MIAEIIGVILIIGFFFVLSKVGIGMLGKEHPLVNVFPIGSGVLVAFFLGLMFLGE